jgi:putative DNA primase/helicase
MVRRVENGIGKTRADRFGFMRKRQAWRLIFLSTGEINLSEHMQQAGAKVRAGQEVRIIDIPADTGVYGIFEDLHGFSSGAAFADMLIKNSYQYHGVAAREFLKYLVRNEERAISEVKAVYQRFIVDHLPKESSGQVQRMISRFALVAAAGELATAFGITGWHKGQAFEAALQCFQQMISARGGAAPMEEKRALAQVSRFFEQHAESRFTDWFAALSESTNVPRTFNRAGFRKTSCDETEYYVFPEAFRQDICNGLDHNYVESILIQNGWLVPESSGRATRSERLPGTTKKTRCYRFSERVLCDEEG